MSLVIGISSPTGRICKTCLGDGWVHGKQSGGAGGDCNRLCPKCGGTGGYQVTAPLFTRPAKR